MTRNLGVVWCDGCGVEILWAPLVKKETKGAREKDFCCRDCKSGYVCNCSERAEMEDDRREYSDL